MANKLSNASSKICKKQKQQFCSLVEVLRPKVYITDTSNFKRLVQELTGNMQTIEQVPVVLDVETQGDQESTMEASFDSLSQVVMNEEINQTWNQMYVNVTASDSSANEQIDWLAVWELESWLLDIDQPC